MEDYYLNKMEQQTQLELDKKVMTRLEKRIQSRVRFAQKLRARAEKNSKEVLDFIEALEKDIEKIISEESQKKLYDVDILKKVENLYDWLKKGIDILYETKPKLNDLIKDLSKVRRMVESRIIIPMNQFNHIQTEAREIYSNLSECNTAMNNVNEEIKNINKELKKIENNLSEDIIKHTKNALRKTEDALNKLNKNNEFLTKVYNNLIKQIPTDLRKEYRLELKQKSKPKKK